MSQIDGTSESEKIERAVIEPEKCENKEDFEKAINERTDQLKEVIDKDSNANKYVDSLASNCSTEEILKKKDEAGDLGEKCELFENACFGDHGDMSEKERAEMIATAKGDWENSVSDNYMCDKALERQGYDSTEHTGDSDLKRPPKMPSEARGDFESSTYQPEPTRDHSGGREMDEASKAQLMEQQAESNAFLVRNGGIDDYPELDKYTNWEKADVQDGVLLGDHSEGFEVDDETKAWLAEKEAAASDFSGRRSEVSEGVSQGVPKGVDEIEVNPEETEDIPEVQEGKEPGCDELKEQKEEESNKSSFFEKVGYGVLVGAAVLGDPNMEKMEVPTIDTDVESNYVIEADQEKKDPSGEKNSFEDMLSSLRDVASEMAEAEKKKGEEE